MIVPTSAARQLVCGGAILMMSIVTVISPGVCPAQNLDDKAERSWPMFGGSPGRNMVNAIERNIPADWCVVEGKRKNVKWMAELGNRTFGSPIVADGKIFVATNNARPRDPKVKGPKAVLMAFRESDGQFLWQNVHDVPDLGLDSSRSAAGLPSTPAVLDRKLYYITPACEVVCAETDDGKIQWRYDMMKELEVHPGRCYCLTPPLSSPLVIGKLVFAVTGNGLDYDGNDERKLVSPKAPSFVALDRRTGNLAWQSNLPGENIIEGQWSSPTFAVQGGMPQVIFAGGDCVIYSFTPDTGKLLWKCDCLPTRTKKDGHRIDKGRRGIDNHIVGTPVVLGDKLYVGLGLPSNHPEGTLARRQGSFFLCLDITKTGDVSLKSYDAKSDDNKGSALVWAFGGSIEPRPKEGRPVYFGPTSSTAAVHDGLVYITEEYGYLHCLDAATGKHIWKHDFVLSVGSPYWVDNRVFVGTEDGEIVIFAHGRTPKLLATIDMEDGIYTTPVAVNGTLYLATRSKLFAIGSR